MWPHVGALRDAFALLRPSRLAQAPRFMEGACQETAKRCEKTCWSQVWEACQQIPKSHGASLCATSGSKSALVAVCGKPQAEHSSVNGLHVHRQVHQAVRVAPPC